MDADGYGCAGRGVPRGCPPPAPTYPLVHLAVHPKPALESAISIWREPSLELQGYPWVRRRGGPSVRARGEGGHKARIDGPLHGQIT